MERPDVPQTLTPPPEHQTLATAAVGFQAPSSVPSPEPQTLETAAAPSAVPKLGFELSLNLPSQPIAATENLESMNFGDGGGYHIGRDVFSIFGDEGDAPTRSEVELFAILGNGEEATMENADAVINSVGEVAMENTDAVINSVDGEGAVAGSGSDAFMLFGDEEGAVTGIGFDTAMLFGDDEGAATKSGMQSEGATTLDGVNTDVDAGNMGRVDRLLVTDSIGDALDSSEIDKTRIVNTGMPLMNPPDVSDESNSRKKRSMAGLVSRTNLGMDGFGDEEGVAAMNRGERNEIGDSDDVDGVGTEVEGAVSTQCVRKKSKYLSPTYTNLSWNDMQVALHVDTHALVPRSSKKGKDMTSSSLVPLSPKKGTRSNKKMSKGTGSNDKMSPSITFSFVDVNVFLSDFLSLAVDHYHLKGSCSQHTFMNFYEEFRCSSLDPLSPKKGMELNDKMSKGNESNNKMSPSATHASVDVNVFLSYLLSLAADHYHVKVSRSQHTFRSFYEEFRCSSLIHLSPKKEKGSNDKMSKEKGSNDKMSPSATYSSVDVNVFLSDLLSLAVDHYHLKESRLQHTFRSFYEEFRCSQYLCLNLGNNKVHPVDSETLARGEGDRSKVKATRTSNRRKRGAGSEAATPLNLNRGEAKCDSATPKKKLTKNGVDGQGPLNLVTVSANNSLGKRKANAGGKPISESTSHDPSEFSEGDSPKKRKSNGAGLVLTLLNSRDPSGLPEGGQMVNARLTESNQSGHKKGSKINKKRKSSASKTGKGSRGSTSQQKQKIEEALSRCPAALFMTFSPGSTLPSRDELVSTFSIYGDLMEPRTELVEDSCSACVVFAKGSDAEKAFNSPDKKTVSGSQISSFRLRYLPESMPSPVAQPVKKTPRPSRSVAQRFKNSELRKNLERLLRSLIRPFSVGQAAGTAEWMNQEVMEELDGDMKALMEKINRLLTQPPPATSH